MVLFLYGDTRNALSIESIMDKLSTPNTFSTAIEEFENVVGHAGESSEHLLDLMSIYLFIRQKKMIVFFSYYRWV